MTALDGLNETQYLARRQAALWVRRYNVEGRALLFPQEQWKMITDLEDNPRRRETLIAAAGPEPDVDTRSDAGFDVADWIDLLHTTTYKRGWTAEVTPLGDDIQGWGLWVTGVAPMPGGIDDRIYTRVALADRTPTYARLVLRQAIVDMEIKVADRWLNTPTQETS